MKQFSSIFNDVLGPVMSGPSSSHTAASVRIGYMMRQLLGEKPVHFTVCFDPSGALAPCYREQWADRGLCAGLLGMLPQDPRLSQAFSLAEENGLTLAFQVEEFENHHPNTYRMQLTGISGKTIDATALSTGGGMIVFTKIQNEDVHVTGGFYETFLWGSCPSESQVLSIRHFLEEKMPNAQIFSCFHGQQARGFWHIRTEQPLDEEALHDCSIRFHIDQICRLTPILPITSQLVPSVPFHDTREMLQIAKRENKALWEMALLYESVRGNCSREKVLKQMEELVETMEKALSGGLCGTSYENRILGCQSRYLKQEEIRKKLLGDSLTNDIILCVSALMEVKSAMGIFVAAPTAGSCGTLAGTVLAAARCHGFTKEQVVKAMLSAGMIGVFLSEKATFAAEVAGCQAECGSASGMTAAALAQLMGASCEEACAAASMALQNVFGLTCDPVAMAVEVPCLGKNILAGVNALTSANMAMAGFDPVVPLDQTIEAFNEAGRLLPAALRCTGKAGLTCTAASKEIEKKLSLSKR